jgi:hypothetical protein
MHKYTYLNLSKHTQYGCLCVFAYVYTCISYFHLIFQLHYFDLPTYIQICIHIYVYVRTYIHVCIYIYIYINSFF